jgi:valyl-tRNA synthetase
MSKSKDNVLTPMPLLEEVWSWWRDGSVHRARWPQRADVLAAGTEVDPALLDVVSAVLMEVRKAKSEEHRPQRSPVARLVVEDGAAQLAALRAGQQDLCNAGTVAEMVLQEAPQRSVSVELAPVAEPVPGGS